MKQSQLYSQIFVYVLTVVLISFILIYGYNSVQNFKERADKVSCLRFKNDLTSAVNTIMGDFGSVRKKELELCSGYNQVCFVETFEQFDRSNPELNTGQLDPIIKDSIFSNIDKNVFFVGGESFYAGNISVENNVLCLNAVNNKISLRLESKGNHILLSQWT